MEEKPITELQLLLTNSPSSSDVVSAILRYKTIGPGEYRIREYPSRFSRRRVLLRFQVVHKAAS